MVSDNTNKIFTELMEYMQNEYPSIEGGQSYNEKSVTLPYVYFSLLDAPTRLQDLSNNEVGVSEVYQIEIYTDDGDYQARKMSSYARAYMISLGFKCRTFMPIVTASNVSRFVGRYERLAI